MSNSSSQPPRVIAERRGAVGYLIFNQPSKHNAISYDMSSQAADFVRQFNEDDAIRVIIVTGHGTKAFVSGHDISEFDELRSDAKTTKSYHANANAVYHALHGGAKPSIARIHGYCFGGGVALAAACDLRYCSDDACFAVTSSRLGIAYPLDLTRFVIGVIGPAHAREMLLTGNRFSAGQAAAMGLVNRVLAKDQLAGFVEEVALTIAENAPLAVRAAKYAVDAIADNDTAKLSRYGELADACADSEDFANARTAFAAKRKPRFAGR